MRALLKSSILLVVIVGYSAWLVTNSIHIARAEPATTSDSRLVLNVYLVHFDAMIVGEQAFISAGTFQMGCNPALFSYACDYDENPLHAVYLDTYKIDRFEVTNSEYKQCVAAGACSPPRKLSTSAFEDYYVNPIFNGFPVVNVTWSDAENFCTWKGKRLPTEAEWERAARGRWDVRLFPWGFSLPDCTLCNYLPNPRFGPCVGYVLPSGNYLTGVSPDGIFDMAGNIWEWVSDWYSDTYYRVSPASNPQGPAAGSAKVVRGGSWKSGWDFIRVSNRELDQPGAIDEDLGFRCASTP